MFPMMSAEPEPPDLLAQLCATFLHWERRGWLRQRLPQAEAVLVSEAVAGPVPEPELLRRWAEFQREMQGVSKSKGPAAKLFFDALKLLHALDAWHADLASPLGRMTATQQRVRTRFLIGIPEASGATAYNRNIQFGLIIPPWAHAEERSPSQMSLLSSLLDHTAYLPPLVAAGEANDPQKLMGRRLLLRYVHGPSGLPAADDGAAPILALAPVLDGPADARIVADGTAGRYGVELCYDWARLETIFDTALASGARVLLLPEMTIRHSEANRLMRLFKKKLRDSVHRGDEPSLLYVIAGLVAATGTGGAAGSNGIVIFHALQDENDPPFIYQSKLCRWNLDQNAQEEFLHEQLCAVLEEDIDEGKEIYVADLVGLGRTLTLICADMDANEPGHWVINNVGVDWLYAPIMDRSIKHRTQSGQSGRHLKPWVVDRAAVAVRMGARRAIVVNSLALTYANNDATVSRPYLPFDRCGWAFLLDGTDTPRKYRELSAPLPLPPEQRPVVSIVRWLEDFDDAPDYM
jgi:hypothetical protein